LTFSQDVLGEPIFESSPLPWNKNIKAQDVPEPQLKVEQFWLNSKPKVL
jgi:hypothetical protein